MLTWFNKHVQFRWLQHTGFWLLSLGVLTVGFSMSWPVTKADLVYTLLFHVSLISAVYIHLRVLVPIFLLRRRYVFYVPLLCVLMLLAVLLNEFTYQYLSDWIIPGYFFISYYTRWQIALFVGIYLLMTTLLKFSRSWAELQKMKLALEETRRRNVETELQALRDQVNPHFLFNSLHSIYALALERNARTAELVLRLAEILRFLLYENKGEKISLTKEVECIEAFIALQRERLPKTAHVQFDKVIETKDPEIAPLLLLPLVENAFKHGVIGGATDIRMDLTLREGQLNFDVRNHVPSVDKNNVPGGIGLQNLRRRLSLLYPNHHSLEISPATDTYLVRLSIDL